MEYFFHLKTKKKSFSRYLPSPFLLKAFPVPVAVCLGATFYYLQNSTGEILRRRLPSNKDLAVPPLERREEGGMEERKEGGNAPTGAAAGLSQLEPWFST